jgi:hypothetical protein
LLGELFNCGSTAVIVAFHPFVIQHTHTSSSPSSSSSSSSPEALTNNNPLELVDFVIITIIVGTAIIIDSGCDHFRSTSDCRVLVALYCQHLPVGVANSRHFVVAKALHVTRTKTRVPVDTCRPFDLARVRCVSVRGSLPCLTSESFCDSHLRLLLLVVVSARIAT